MRVYVCFMWWSVWALECMTRLHKRGSKHTCVWACDKGSSMWGCEISGLAQSHFFTHLSSVPQMSDLPAFQRMTNMACQRACVLHSPPYTTHFAVLFHLTYCLMIAPQNWCHSCLCVRVCSQFSVVLRARYQSWGCGPCQDTFIDVCTRKCVYMCVVKACQWPIRGKIETPLGTDSLNQHNLLGFTIRPGDSSIACWHTSPVPAAPQTADYLLNSLQLQRCELTPLSIPLCHTHRLIFLTGSHVIFLSTLWTLCWGTGITEWWR